MSQVPPQEYYASLPRHTALANFLFDGGRLDSGPDREIRLQDGELAGWTLAAPPEWDGLLAPHMARRVRACASALANGTTACLQHGWPLTDAL